MNEKKEEKWTVNLRDDQCRFISAVMEYIVARSNERIGNTAKEPFERFSAAQVKMHAEHIIALIEEITS